MVILVNPAASSFATVFILHQCCSTIGFVYEFIHNSKATPKQHPTSDLHLTQGHALLGLLAESQCPL